MKRWLIVSSFVLLWLGWASAAHANIQMSGGGWDAGDVHLGNSAMMTRTLTVTGATPETYDNITITAGSGTTLADCTSQFSVSPLTGTVSNVSGGSLDVTFTPAAGKRQMNNCVGTFKLAAASIGTFTLAGRGVAPNMILTTGTPLDFGTVRVANGAPLTSARNATIMNSGNADLQITAASIGAGDYSFTSVPSFPITVVPGASTTFNITFDPSASGTQMSTLTVNGKDPSIGSTPLANVVVTLTGQGGNARIHVSNFNDTSNTVDFGIAPNSVATPAQVRVANDAAAPKSQLQITTATIVPTTGGSTWFSFGTNGGFNCAPGSTSCNISQGLLGSAYQIGVICNPNPATANETQTATISVASDTDPTGSVSSATLSCTSGRSNMAVSVTQMSFPDTRVGTDSGTQTFSITNSGNINGTYSIAKTGANAGDFIISNCPTSGSVAPTNGSVTCNVVFHPNSIGSKTATFTITTNDPDPGEGSRTITPVTGNGVQPEISGPALVDFLAIDLGSSSGAQMVTITNPGTQALTISSATLIASPAYAITNGTSGVQVVPANNGTTTWMIVCTPTVQGANAGQFRIISDAATSATLNIPLACNGQRGLFSANPPSIDFGGVPQGMMVQRTFMLQNTGNLAVTGITGTLMQTAGQGYVLDMTSVPGSLAPSAIATVKVNFNPADGNAGGPASVTIAGNWTGNSAHAINIVIPLNGDGLSEGVDVTPALGLDYGNFRWDAPKSMAFCIVNNSQFAVNILDVAINPTAGTMTNEFVRTGLKRQPTCHVGGSAVVGLPLPMGSFLQPNEILEVTITATPMSRVGSLGADVVITTDLTMNPTRHIGLMGVATSGAITFAPSMDLELGKIDVDAGPVTQMITITNTGAADFDLSNFLTTVADPKIQITLPATQTLAPTASAQIGVTYDPDLVEENNVTITSSVAHILGGPTMATFHVHGTGIDRTFAASPLDLTFPDTFKNPGSKAPKQTIMVMNTGEAPLNVSMTMLQGDTQFTLVDPSPFLVAGLGSHPVEVTFTPTMIAQYNGTLLLTNDDDKTPMGMIQIHGMGIGRNVMLDPMTNIELGNTAVGIPVTVDAFNVTSMDSNNAFVIRAVALSDPDGPFSIVDAPSGTADPATVDQGVDLAPSGTRDFQIAFSAETEGFFETVATLYLDEDPEPQGMITLRGTAVNLDLRGGGGCSSSAGGGTGAMALAIVIGGVLARRRRLYKRAAVVVCTAAAVAIPGIAAADDNGQPSNLDVGVFNPTPTTINGTWNVQTADVGKDGDWVAGAMVSYATKPLIGMTTQLGTANLISTRTMYELGGAYAFLNRFEAGLRMPLYTQNGDTATTEPIASVSGTAAKGTARGDLVIHGKARLIDIDLLSLGAGLALTLPTATDGQYTGVDLPSVRVLALATVKPHKRLTITANAGGVLREKAHAGFITQGSGLAYGASATFRVLDKLWVAGEIFGEMVPSGQKTPAKNGGAMVTMSALSPTEGLLGVTYRLERRVNVGFALGRGITDSVGSPALRGVFSISFAPGTPELKPIHPPPPPKIDGDPDGDGILDSKDQCDNEPEDVDQFEDDDGCPEPDNDKDGVADAADRCPLDAEDKDGFQDADGCPDKDNDNDGMPDDKDKCPDKAEDKDGFQDADGCPDPDNDNDGIPDEKDKCVDKPETINGIQDDDGCPDKGDSVVVVSPDRLETLEAITFAGGSAKITKPSFNVLGQVAATLRAHPEIIRVRVTVHVQPSSSATKDQELTDKRATAVREWLIQWGIASSRLDARGFGGTKPLVPAGNPGAAGVNERLELIILERK